MKITRAGLIAFCVVGLLVGLALGQVIISNSYQLPQTGHIAANMNATLTINNVAWTNGTSIDWGALTAGQSKTMSVQITNIGTIQINTITLTTTGLPNGWTETMSSLSSPLIPTLQVTGTLTLNVAGNATSGSYSWNSYIITS